MHVRKRLSIFVAALVVGFAALLAAPEVADAQAGPPPNVRLDVHGNLCYFEGYQNLGAGVRVDIPILREGFISGTRVPDDFSISSGLDLLWWYGRYSYSGVGFIQMVMAQWNIYFAQHWSGIVELGIALLWGPRGWNDRFYRNYVAPT